MHYRMRSRWSAFVLALATTLTLTSVANPATADTPNANARSKECSPAHLKNCPKPGSYVPGRGDPVIYLGADFDISWAWSTVEAPPPGQVPQFFHVNVRYTNSSPNILYFTCSGWEDPTKVKEWFYRNGKVIGYVAADHTLCSDHPDANFTLAPGRFFVSWARFHNVPWIGDRIAIEWGEFGRGAFLDPYRSGPTP